MVLGTLETKLRWAIWAIQYMRKSTPLSDFLIEISLFKISEMCFWEVIQKRLIKKIAIKTIC